MKNIFKSMSIETLIMIIKDLWPRIEEVEVIKIPMWLALKLNAVKCDYCKYKGAECLRCSSRETMLFGTPILIDDSVELIEFL